MHVRVCGSPQLRQLPIDVAVFGVREVSFEQEASVVVEVEGSVQWHLLIDVNSNSRRVEPEALHDAAAAAVDVEEVLFESNRVIMYSQLVKITLVMLCSLTNVTKGINVWC